MGYRVNWPIECFYSRKLKGTILDTLYQERLLTLAKTVKNGTKLITPSHYAKVNNPICGDSVSAHIHIIDTIITAADIEVKGCALCEVGAAIWLQTVRGKNLCGMADQHQMISDWLSGTNDLIDIDEVDILKPIKAIKNRHKCLLLAFSTAEHFTLI